MRSFFTSATLALIIVLSSSQSAHAVNIAIMDTGLNPSIVGGVTDFANGRDFVNGDNDAFDDSRNAHGTATGFIAATTGGGPVTLTPIKIFGPNFETNSSIQNAGFSYLAGLSGPQVVSISGSQLQDTPLETLQAVANSGKILVFQAGNRAGANPAGDALKVDRIPRSIIVGGVTPDGTQIQSFSNRAGVYGDFYVVQQTNSLTTDSNGTSMATPRVAAQAARIINDFGFLSPDQVVRLILETAIDLGAPGVDAVFGHGLADLGASLAAAGEGNIPSAPGSSGGGGGGGSGLGIAALAIGGIAAYVLTNKEDELQKTVLVDSFGRAFTFGLADRLSVRDPRPSIFSLTNNLKADVQNIVLDQSINSYTSASVFSQSIDSFRYTANDEKTEDYVSFLHRTNSSGSNYALALNSDLSSDFGALSLRNKNQSSTQPRFSFNQLFTTPVLGYSSQGSSFTYGWNNQKVNHRLGLSVIDEQQENGHVSNSLLYETSIVEDKYNLGFQLGALIEEGSFLGGSSDSAFGADNTTTYYLGFNGAYQLSKNITLLGGLFHGLSDVEESKDSLLSDFSSVRSQGYAIGMLVDNLFSSKGSFGLSYSSPLQTTDGSATLSLPVGQNRNTGEIRFESSNLNFDTVDSENILEAYYNFQLNRKSNVFAQMSYTKNPVSNLNASRDRTFFVGWKRSF